jgi:hypothetical protein
MPHWPGVEIVTDTRDGKFHYIGPRKIAVWPAGQRRATEENGTIAVTTFDDTADYHPGLIARILQLSRDQQEARRPVGRGLGTKVYHLERWRCPEADLISARAMALFEETVPNARPRLALSWASIYQRGDYSVPHSHTEAVASIVYFLDLGDPDSDDPLSGRFSIVDPRLAVCCLEKPNCATHPFLPEVAAGSMIIFPSQVVHWVHPYGGKRPRISLSWNLARAS